MRVYLSGKITNTEDYIKRFLAAERELEDQYDIINPAIICSFLPETMTHDEYMSVCFPLLDLCDAVYVIDAEDAKTSDGVKQEILYALATGKTVMSKEKISLETLN